MALLEWSAALELNAPVMDDTHREFVALLNALGEASDGDLLSRMDAFIAHTEQHFAMEEQWMTESAFPPYGCHKGEHDNILEVVREVRKRIVAGELHFGATLATALAEWFPQHAQSMDAVLALYLREKKFDVTADERR